MGPPARARRGSAGATGSRAAGLERNAASRRASDADSRVHEVEMTEQNSPTPSAAAGRISANNNDINSIDNSNASNSGSNANSSSGGDGGLGLQGLQGARVLLSLLVLVTLGQVYMLWPSLETLEAPLAEEMASNGPLVWSPSSASPPPPLAECEDSDRLASPRDREAAVARAVHRVFERGQLEVPPEGCRTTETIESLSVQLFMPKERVHKFTDWSYEHVSGVACEWGGVVRGTDDEETNPVDAAVAAYAKRNSKALTVPRAQFNSPANYSWNAVYCAPDNYRADVEVNFHKRDPARVPSHRAKAPFCFDLLQYDHKEDGPNRGKRFRIQIPRRGDLSPGAVLDDRPAHLAAAQASRRFQLAFDRLRTCDVATPTSRVAMHVEPPECGAGCSLNYLVSPLLHAISTDQAFLTPASMWASRSECGGSNSLSCFLQAFAKRDDSLAQCAKSSGPRYEKEYQRWRRIGQDDYGQWSGPEKLARSASGFEDFGIMWNVGQVLKNLLQFSPHVERELARRVRLSGLDQVENQPVLGLHVRLGDACSDPKLFEKGRRCDPLSYYMPALKLLRARYGFKSVYLATDSAEVIRNATTQYRDFKWLYNDAIDRSRYAVFDRASQEDEVTIEGVLFGDKRLHDAGFSKTQEMVDFLVDTYILGVHTSGFVGKFTSNMDRIVTALGAATGNEAGTCLKPTISLDSDWCYDFMVQSGLGLNGKLFFC
ncbi:Alpha-1,6-fucosyltransferase [Hondaea fermentalgiana]|uniref:Alpha-1,6-fucosyltransferase n=1 Tax=Hondaea fermentalgiana TaxID=2315210 RepID=A0A2R5FYQ8_9STRA|nr:Alpha-1,6-fucosyltransferase [Hondaea fermentalgiana]|eukprot:GBG23896.1 Alpha-1,6-fucosyltransferase [Hondaea fermentalgiana]